MKRLFPEFSTNRPDAGNKMNRSMSRLNLRSPLALGLISFALAASMLALAASAAPGLFGSRPATPSAKSRDAISVRTTNPDNPRIKLQDSRRVTASYRDRRQHRDLKWVFTPDYRQLVLDHL
jgi:hypothetical protein